MSDIFQLGMYILGFFALGMLINHTADVVYWAWVDWKDRKNRNDS